MAGRIGNGAEHLALMFGRSPCCEPSRRPRQPQTRKTQSGHTGHTRFMTGDIRPVRRQHTVTERILRGFASPRGQLAVFDKAYRQRRLHSPGANLFVTEFDTWDSRGAEARWNLFEDKFPDALERVAQHTALADPRTVETLRDLVALHWLRSRAMMVAREQAATRFFNSYRRSAPDTRAEMLAETMRQTTGLHAASRSALEWTVDRLVAETQDADVPRWHSQWNVDYFAAARVRLGNLEIGIHHTAGRDLAIGDCPVITTITGRGGAGPHQNVGIQKADHIAMPITPDTLLTFGEVRPAMNLTGGDVEQYNDLQWSTYVLWVAARPNGTADARFQREANL